MKIADICIKKCCLMKIAYISMNSRVLKIADMCIKSLLSTEDS